MYRVRENSNEFGGCSLVNKAFREALKPFYTSYKFTYLHSRLMRLFVELKNRDFDSKRGKRSVANGVAVLKEWFCCDVLNILLIVKLGLLCFLNMRLILLVML